LNEHLWEIVDEAAADADSYAAAFDAMADALRSDQWDEYANGDFFHLVGETMHDWLDCLDAIDADREVDAPAAAADD
jgi:hypothetical protein